ncbi:hypothetical protein MJO28_010491, partial [Puccinia striiformis f. sp. tritici]
PYPQKLIHTFILSQRTHQPCLFLRHSPLALLFTSTRSQNTCLHGVIHLHFGWCHNCLKQVGLVDKGVQQQTPSRPASIFNAIPLPSHPTQPLALTSLLLPMAEPANCTGTQAYFCDHCKVKRTKTSTPSLCARAARSAHPPPQSMTKSNLSVVALYSTSYTSSKKLAPCVACYKLMFSNLIRICLSNNSYGTCSHRHVPACGAASLSTQMNFLGRPPQLTSIQRDGWVVAQHLKFNHNDVCGQQSASLHRYQHLPLDHQSQQNHHCWSGEYE